MARVRKIVSLRVQHRSRVAICFQQKLEKRYFVDMNFYLRKCILLWMKGYCNKCSQLLHNGSFLLCGEFHNRISYGKRSQAQREDDMKYKEEVMMGAWWTKDFVLLSFRVEIWRRRHCPSIYCLSWNQSTDDKNNSEWKVDIWNSYRKHVVN